MTKQQKRLTRADRQAIDLLRGLSLQTADLYVHSFLQDAASHLEEHAARAAKGEK
jgi:hypothetical protein